MHINLVKKKRKNIYIIHLFFPKLWKICQEGIRGEEGPDYKRGFVCYLNKNSNLIYDPYIEESYFEIMNDFLLYDCEISFKGVENALRPIKKHQLKQYDYLRAFSIKDIRFFKPPKR